MWALYRVVNNFGVAVILFTLIVKAASFPLSLKQQRNMAVSQLFTPRVQEIQKKYRGNQAKMQEEMQKLQKEGYNPMGGCAPMILTMIILFGVLDVVYKPMTHMERFDRDTVTQIQEISKQVEYSNIILSSEDDIDVILELFALNKAQAELRESGVTDAQRKAIGQPVYDNISNYTGAESKLSDAVKSALRGVDGNYRGLQRELYTVTQYRNSPYAFASALSSEDIRKLDNLKDNMIFLGINLGEIPRFTEFNGLWLIGMLCFVISVFQMMVQSYIQKKTMPAAPNMKFMLLMGPIFSLFIVFVVPAGAGLYWAISYLFMIAQSIIIYKFWPPEKMREQAKERVKNKLGAVEVTAKVVDVDEEGNEVVKEEKVSEMSAKEQKEFFRKKLEEARKADLEKYGETPDIDWSEYDNKKVKPLKDVKLPSDDDDIDGDIIGPLTSQ